MTQSAEKIVMQVMISYSSHCKVNDKFSCETKMMTFNRKYLHEIDGPENKISKLH